MNRRTFGVIFVGVLFVFAGCSADSSPSNQTNSGSQATIVNGSGTTNPSTGTTSDPTSGPENITDSPQLASSANGTFEIHSINVGQSDSTLIIGPTGQTMLIDTGDYSENGEIVLEYLKSHDIDHLDYLVSTHADADHIGGNAEIITYYETEANGIGAVYDSGITSSSQTYQDYLDAVEEYNVTLYETHAGDSIPFEGVQTQVLNPPEEYIDNEERNENSIALRLTFGQASFVLPGDIEETGESHLVDEYGSQLNSTVLKAAHHGSGGSSTNSFLDGVSPQVALISSAYDSQYGHPRPEALSRLAEHNVEVYWTATHGNIVLTSDGHRIDIATQRVAPTNPASVRDGDPIEPGTEGEVTNRESITVGSSAGSNPMASEPTPTASESSPTAGPSDTAIATDGGTAVPADGNASLTIESIHADAEGDDSENLNDEYILFENTGSMSLDISGWTIADDSSHEYTVPSGTVLGAGETITLHTGEGSDSGSDFYWGSGSSIWNNDGDTIRVTTEQGQQVLTEEY